MLARRSLLAANQQFLFLLTVAADKLIKWHGTDARLESKPAGKLNSLALVYQRSVGR